MIRRLLDRPSVVTVFYVALSLIMTWPIAAGITSDIPGDLGDPAFVAGIMAWGAEHWLALFTGDLGAAVRFWDAPSFAPEPMTMVYSEHFALHSLVTLPLYASTRNPVLCYNVWFLATFVLSGLGVYLLVREMTGRPAAAFVAGLAFAFAPYRLGSIAHLQVLSSQWMPFVLFGLRRYFASRSAYALLGTGAALWAQNMSSGSYMVFFGPFIALYALVELATRRLGRSVHVWVALAIAAVAAVAATLPFRAPYLLKGPQTARSLDEVITYSADLLSWVTASESMNVWGWLHPYVKPEGLLFPGVTVVVLALWGAWRAWRVGFGGVMPADERETTALPRAPGPPIQSEHQGLRVAALFGTLALVLSFWLSLGPVIQVGAHSQVTPALYRLLFEYVPGIESVRAPARFATIAVLAMSILAGVALAALDRARRRQFLAVAGVLLLLEGSAAPLPVNGTWTSIPEEFVPPEARLHPLANAPPVYRFLSRLDGSPVVVHFPFGLTERETQYGYYAALHGKRIVNGYGGAFPPTYSRIVKPLRSPLVDPATVTSLLDDLRTTHAVVHRSAYLANRDALVIAMLEHAGWHRTADFAGDVVLEKSGPANERR